MPDYIGICMFYIFCKSVQVVISRDVTSSSPATWDKP